jgi:hypothetical protein
LLKIGSPESCEINLQIHNSEGGVSQFVQRMQFYSYGNMPIFKIVALILLGCTDSEGYVKFTPKYIIVRGEGGWAIRFV